MKSIPPMLPEDYFEKAVNEYVNVMGVESDKNSKLPHRCVNISVLNVSNKQSCVADNIHSRKEIITDADNCNKMMHAWKLNKS